MNTKIYIGPAGWSYKDWNGIVYPPVRHKGFDALRFLSRYFNTIEINSSFYRPPTADVTRIWIERVKDNSDFLFTYKLWQRYSHERERFPDDHEEKLVKQGLDVLRDAGRLGATLIQFPWSFKMTLENIDWLEQILQRYQQYYPVVEVRHQSLNDQILLDLLSRYKASFVNIDQPTIGQSIPLTAHITGNSSYWRLHGRNYRNWFGKDTDVASRYDYLYSERELEQIKQKIEELMGYSAKSFVIFNNHYRGQAVVNAFQTRFFLEKKKVQVPENLLRNYPQLEAISKPMKSQAGQTSLFEEE